MKDFKGSDVVKDLAGLTYTMWQLGWDEKNGGNISCLLSDDDIELLNIDCEGRFIELENIPEQLIGRHIIITAAGSNFRLVKNDIDHTLGVVKIELEGYRIVWGFADDNKPTSEIYMHLLSHDSRLKVDPTHRVVVHNHATEISAMTFVHELDEVKLTRTLWGIITECIIVFPDGVSVLPWMVCGNEEIGRATADKLQTSRIVIWSHHGILATESSLSEAFGLIETVNKAASIYIMTYADRMTSGITDKELKAVCEFFDVIPKEGVLSTVH